MAAGMLSAPGSELGPCEVECAHRDCALTRADADSVCRWCQAPIGYLPKRGTPWDGRSGEFYRIDDQVAHAACEEEAVERDAKLGAPRCETEARILAMRESR